MRRVAQGMMGSVIPGSHFCVLTTLVDKIYQLWPDTTSTRTLKPTMITRYTNRDVSTCLMSTIASTWVSLAPAVERSEKPISSTTTKSTAVTTAYESVIPNEFIRNFHTQGSQIVLFKTLKSNILSKTSRNGQPQNCPIQPKEPLLKT